MDLSNLVLVDNGNGTVTDTTTGLMWQAETASERRWVDALDYCDNLSLAGYNDWRLPNRNELQSIVFYGISGPAIDTNYFPETPSYYYWSSTTHQTNTSNAWWVNFNKGSVNEGANKSNSYYLVRAVRGGQYIPPNNPPSANAGSDRIVFNSVTLDGMASSDTDGTITSWAWIFTHRTNTSYNKTATGQNPTVTNLAKGFYDVVLTVTDNSGDTDTDNMVLGVAGIWDINNDNMLGLAEVIYILQVISDVRLNE